jgi:hypothetical protein
LSALNPNAIAGDLVFTFGVFRGFLRIWLKVGIAENNDLVHRSAEP